MKAAYIRACGEASSIEYGTVEKPLCHKEEVLVKSICVAVNNIDTFVRSGRYKTKIPFPFIIGRDMVGIVTEVGESVTGFSVGDIVWTNSMGYDGRQGVSSEFVSIPQNRLYPLPIGVDPILAVASLHSSATATILLTDIGNAKIGDKILICGAAGHVGRKLVSLAYQMGLSVTTTSSEDDFKMLRSLGAKETYNYNDDQSTYVGKFDFVVDTSGKMPLYDSIAALNIGGKILMITPSPVEKINTWELYTKSSSILGFAISRASVDQLKNAAKIINAQFEKGLLLDEPVFKLSISDASKAHILQEENTKKKPKYVLTFETN